ncbi:MAG: hypothetical protein PHN56_03170 [Candidatus Nanoarchaeia archaeon]|nr:hypothetical protein [Candidatus Nanoarchaeia archaeon]
MMKSKILAIIVLFISLSFSFKLAFSNTQYIEFTIFIDRTAPEYYNETITADIINNSNEEINISAYWIDNHALNFYYYESNITGTFTNSTSKSFTQGYSNETIKNINADYEGRSVYYKLIGFDRVGNLNSTEYTQFSILNQTPLFTNVSQSNDNIAAGNNITLAAYWNDNFNIKNATLQFDETGWTDKEDMIINSLASWSNFTYNTTGLSGSVSWRIKASDNVGNINTTEAMSFSVI